MTDNVIRLDVSRDEGFLGQVGYLKEWFPQTESAILTVPRTVPSAQVGPSISLFFVFDRLTNLDVTLASPVLVVDQRTICACAELLHLQSLRITGGTLAPPSEKLDLGVLTSLRGLRELTLRPLSAAADDAGDGLEDSHCSDGLAPLTSLRSLDIKASEDLSDAGLVGLSTLKHLTRLSVTPLGLFASMDGLEKLLHGLPDLQELCVGLRQAQQVSMLRAATHVPRVKIVSSDQDMDSAAASFFSTCTLCLQTSLVSLRLCTLNAADPLFLVSIGALTALTELKMGVALRARARPFTCNLTTLRSLRALQVTLPACLPATCHPRACPCTLFLRHTPTQLRSWPHANSSHLMMIRLRDDQVAPWWLHTGAGPRSDRHHPAALHGGRGDGAGRQLAAPAHTELLGHGQARGQQRGAAPAGQRLQRPALAQPLCAAGL